MLSISRELGCLQQCCIQRCFGTTRMLCTQKSFSSISSINISIKTKWNSIWLLQEETCFEKAQLYFPRIIYYQGGSQKFPIWAVSPKLGNFELWSKGNWGPVLKGPNGVRAHFDRSGIKTTICKIKKFSIVTSICPKHCCTQLSCTRNSCGEI